MIHNFVNGVCVVCGETLDWLADGKLRDRAFIGPKLPVNDDQMTFQYTLNLVEMI